MGTWKAGLLALVLAAPLAASAQQNDRPWFDPGLPVSRRVDALIAQMTLEEKASQMVNQSRAIPRLGIPAYNWWSEALHGVAFNGYATVFPEPVGLAATFDAPLIYDMAVAIGTEARVKYNIVGRETGSHAGLGQGLDFWSPNINIFRDPRWGRGQETYGEDPYLTARFGVGFGLLFRHGIFPRRAGLAIFFRVRIFGAFVARERADHQVDGAAHELGLEIGMPERRDFRDEFIDDLEADLRVRHFTAAKFQSHLDLHVFAQKTDGVHDLDAEVVRINARA